MKIYERVKYNLLRITFFNKLQRVKYYIDHYKHAPPLNGQEQRQKCFEAIINALKPEELIETGTFLGNTTKYLAEKYQLPVYSVEINYYYYLYSKSHLLLNNNIHILPGDSRKLLHNRQMAGANKKKTFIYLDAHWYLDVPLIDEIDYIYNHWDNAVICVDDFKVDDDPGYKYDTYDEISLCIESINTTEKPGLDFYYPAAHSSDETGMKRGCIYIVKGDEARKNIKQCVPSYLRPI